MNIARMLRENREKAGLSRKEFAEKAGIPEIIAVLIEEPEGLHREATELFANALGVTPQQFRGEKPPEPTEEEKQAAFLEKARYPHIRRYLCTSPVCADPGGARGLFGDQEFSLPERNIVLYLLTNALYAFCDTNVSEFGFDAYLFQLHDPLLKKFEQRLAGMADKEDAKERIATARSNVFACARIEDIAVMALEDFAGELEEKLKNKSKGYEKETGLPFTWKINEDLMQIVINDPAGVAKETIRLLDVKQKRKEAVA